MSSIFDNDHYGIIADKVCLGIVAFTTVIVALRLYCRSMTGPERFGLFGFDDALVLLSLAIIWATQILIMVAASYGLGRHFNTLSPGQKVLAQKYDVVINVVIQWAFSTPKFSIIVLLRRILNYGTRTAVLFWTVALVGQVSVVALSIWNFKQCDPVEKNWETDLPGRCADPGVLTGLGLFVSAYSAFLDLFFALYPIPMVMRLHLPLRTRIVVCVTLGLGSVACAVQVYKMSIINRAWAILAHDPTFPTPYLNTMGMTEACILIIAASLPTLGPLVRSLKRKRTQPSNGKYIGTYTRRTSLTGTTRRGGYAVGTNASRAHRSWSRIYDRPIYERGTAYRDSMPIGNRTLVSSAKEREEQSDQSGTELGVLVTMDVTVRTTN